MIVHVKLFASARERAGADQLELDLPINADLFELRKILNDQYPCFREMTGRWAVNLEFVPESTRVGAVDEIAWIPPISGG